MLAAGLGARLGSHTVERPKPLIQVHDRPLICHTLAGIAAVGIDEAVVVTGYQAELLQASLRCKTTPRVRFVHNPDYRRNASFSLRAARQAIGNRPFLLTMSDHLLSADLLSRLLEAAESPETEAAAFIAVDRSEAWSREYVSEATRVTYDAYGRVGAIGKDLRNWDALDTGAFACTPLTWEYVDRAPEDCDISTIFRQMIDDGALCIADVTGAFWYDIDTEDDLRGASQMLESA